ncbi:MAG: hypothetical protein Q7U28_10635 [Aquabacterium sp.]|nr:hypothetical protein [Aquabacterium sp.]
MKKVTLWGVLAAVTMPLWGCGSLHLYDKEADTAANAAKADYDASKITEALKAGRAMLDALEKKEVEAFRKVTLAGRDIDLLSLLDESGTATGKTIDNGLIPRFNKLVDARLSELAGSPTGADILTRKLQEAKSAMRAATQQEKNARSQMLTFHEKFAFLPACSLPIADLEKNPTADAIAKVMKDPAFKPSTIPTSVAWGTPIKTLAATCARLLKSRGDMTAALTAAENGELARATILAKTYQTALKDQQAEAEKAGKDLKKASKELAAAQKAATAEAKAFDLTCDEQQPKAGAATAAVKATSATIAATGSVADKKNNLCEALAKLKNLGDSGVKVISEERIEKINGILAAMSGLPPATGQDATEPGLALLGATARFSQALQQYQSAGKLPALEPLLIEKQLATAQLAYSTAGEEIAKTRVSLAEESRDATLLEMDLLLKAKATMGGFGTVPASGTPCTTQTAVFCASMQHLQNAKALQRPADRSSEPANRMAYRSLALLSESYTVARDRQQTAELQMVLTEYGESLLRSEAAIAAWNSVISTPIDQLKAYHAGGVTPQDFAQLLQALGVVGIAVRVK